MIRIEIETENAAFSDNDAEVSRILRNLAQRIETRGLPTQDHPYPFHDSNGNSVGQAVLV